MMSEEGSNVFSRDEGAATSNKSPTLDSNPNSPTEQPRVSTDQAEARTVICANNEMTQIAARVERVKESIVRKFKTSKQNILEQFGKADKTMDSEMEQKIANLMDLNNRYREVLNAATTYATHFNALIAAQKQLAESFYQLSLREVDLKEKLNDQNEGLRQSGQFGDEFSKQLAYFVSSIETLHTKTIKDTLLTVQVYETARLEYDSQRNEISLLQQAPNSDRANIDALQQKCDALKVKYDQLKEDVMTKMALLEENRLKVLRDQLDKFEKGLHQYFTESIKALAQNSPKTENNDAFVRGERGIRGSSFLEQ